MKPILFPYSSTTFTSQGLGALSDATSCVVREERNGEYELTMTYPIGGIHYDEIEDRAIIYAKPSPYRDPQPFRIYSVETNISGMATIHAHHISYDLSGIAVSPFNATSCSGALSGLITNSVVTNPFTAWTDKAVDGDYKLTVPSSFRACLGGQENSILDVYGKGEYEFDKYAIKLHTNRGANNGVVIAYGKNLIDFNMERNLESVTTAVYPYWADVDENVLVELDDKLIQLYDPRVPIYLMESGGNFLAEATQKRLVVQNLFDYDNVMVLDLSSEFEEQPSQEQLFNRAKKYITDNQLARPKVSIDVYFIDLASTEDYKAIAPVEQVELCDIVTVRFPTVGIEVEAEVISTDYNVLLDRYDSVEIGDARATLDRTLAQAAMSPTKEEVKAGMRTAADYINNTHGTFEWIDNGDGTNGGFTIYEADDTSSWLRCTAGGIGISDDGGLTYTNAITKNGVTASRIYVQNSDIEVMKVIYYEDAMQGTIQLNNPITGVKGFDVNVTNGGSGYHLYRVDTGEETIGMSAVGYDTYANTQIHMDDPDTGDTRIMINTYRDSSIISAHNLLEIYGALETNSAEAILLQSALNSSNQLTNQMGLYNRSGSVVFRVEVTDNGSPSFYYDGHTLVWKTFTVSGTTYHVLGY